MPTSKADSIDSSSSNGGNKATAAAAEARSDFLNDHHANNKSSDLHTAKDKLTSAVTPAFHANGDGSSTDPEVSRHDRKPGTLPPIEAFYNLNLFLLVWVGSIGIVPAALAFAAFRITYIPLVLVALYYGYRQVVPLNYWKFIHHRNIALEGRAKYFRKQRLVVEDDAKAILKPEGKVMLSAHPHGVTCLGWSCNFNSNRFFPPYRFNWLSADSLHVIPLISDYLEWCGGRPASKQYMLKYMKEERNLGLLPGGFEEATIYERGKHRIYIKNRAGFLKYALQYGYTILPAYTFGEELTYHTFTPLMKYRIKLNDFKVPGVIFAGKYGMGFVPDWDVELTSVIGSPMQLPQIDNPTEADIKEYHEKYIQRIQQLFDKYKGQYAAEGEKAKLEIW